MPDNKDTETINDDAKFASDYLNALPSSALVSDQINNVIKGDIMAKMEYARLIEKIGLDENGAIRMATTSIKTENHQIDYSYPFLTSLDNSQVVIDNAKFGLDIELTTNKTQKNNSESNASGSFDAHAKAKFLFCSVGANIHAEAKYSSSEERTHSQDSSCKVHFDFEMKRTETPYGLKKILDDINNLSMTLVQAELQQKSGSSPEKPQEKPDSESNDGKDAA